MPDKRYNPLRSSPRPNIKINIPRFAAFLVITCGIVYIFLNLFTPRFLPASLRIESLDRPLNILILGSDIVYDEEHRIITTFKGHTDTMILARLDPFSCQVTLLSIPRDTLVEIPKYGPHKINVANFLGGPALAKEAVSRFLSVPIGFYISLNPQGLIKLIDSLGGLRLYVDKDMLYTDKWGHLSINLKKGWHKLSGKEVDGFIRFRKDPLGDIGRIQRQQQFLGALFKKTSSPLTLIRAPFLISILRKNIKTDLSGRDIFRLANFTRMIKRKDLHMIILPGSFSEAKEGYWLPDLVATQKVLEDWELETRK